MNDFPSHDYDHLSRSQRHIISTLPPEEGSPYRTTLIYDIETEKVTVIHGAMDYNELMAIAEAVVETLNELHGPKLTMAEAMTKAVNKVQRRYGFRA